MIENIFKDWIEAYNKLKIKKYKNINPTFIPRNHILEKIINDSYKGDFNLLNEFEKTLKNPYKKNINKIFKNNLMIMKKFIKHFVVRNCIKLNF